MFAHTKSKKPLQAVMIPVIPRKNDEGKINIQVYELLKHAKTVREVISRNKDKHTYSAILYLGDDVEIHDVRTILPLLSVEGSELFFVAHGNPEVVGTAHNYGIYPEELAELFADILGKEGCGIKHIKLLSCNSGYKREGSKIPSYAERFLHSMHALGYKELSVSGYIGFIGEFNHKSRTYVTAFPYKGQTGQRIYRADESEIIFKANGVVVLPKVKITPKVNPPIDRDLVFNALTQNLPLIPSETVSLSIPVLPLPTETNEQQENEAQVKKWAFP